MKIRLSSGNPAPYQRSGVSPREEPAEESLTRIRYFAPNTGHDDAALKCGCTIPWPVIAEFGRHLHGLILCSQHGYQPQITKTELARIERKAKQCQKSVVSTPLGVEVKPPY